MQIEFLYPFAFLSIKHCYSYPDKVGEGYPTRWRFFGAF
jgi:hypothetical protein